MTTLSQGAAFLITRALLKHPRRVTQNTSTITFDAIVPCEPTANNPDHILCCLTLSRENASSFLRGYYDIFATVNFRIHYNGNVFHGHFQVVPYKKETENGNPQTEHTDFRLMGDIVNISNFSPNSTETPSSLMAPARFIACGLVSSVNDSTKIFKVVVRRLIDDQRIEHAMTFNIVMVYPPHSTLHTNLQLPNVDCFVSVSGLLQFFHLEDQPVICLDAITYVPDGQPNIFENL
ncbi:hypothetical protein EDB85DRAFT_811048 [Lactarius pseudohatsudake]|nr:hypothetical protein EDB85DRAFT_811048 [Lactarius pseudohatsudake]